MKRNRENYLLPEKRAAVIRKTFEAIATVGFFHWWKSESPEALRDSGLSREELRQAYLKDMEKDSWPDFQRMAANTPDGRLQDMLQDWVDKSNALGLLEWLRQQSVRESTHVNEKSRSREFER